MSRTVGDASNRANPGLIHSSFRYQEMEVGMEIDPVAKGLNGRDDPGHQLTPRGPREIAGQ